MKNLKHSRKNTVSYIICLQQNMKTNNQKTMFKRYFSISFIMMVFVKGIFMERNLSLTFYKLGSSVSFVGKFQSSGKFVLDSHMRYSEAIPLPDTFSICFRYA